MSVTILPAPLFCTLISTGQGRIRLGKAAIALPSRHRVVQSGAESAGLFPLNGWGE